MKQKVFVCSGGHMDRRQIKTKQAIYKAFNSLLLKKEYSQITVQNIIDEANIGRSTFYLHFDTKIQLLDAMCDDFFVHISETPKTKERTHDFSHSSFTLKNMVSHILYHLKDSSSSIWGLLKSSMSHFFFDRLEMIFWSFCEENVRLNDLVPKELAISYIAGNLINSCKFFIATDFKDSPEQLAQYFMASIEPELASK